MEQETTYKTAGQVEELCVIQEIIKAFFLDESLTEEQENFLKVNCENIQKFLDAPLDSPQDAETKKIFAKVILLAKQKGILPENLKSVIPEAKPNETESEKQERIEETAQNVADAVDEGLDKIKIDYKVGAGEMLAQQAWDRVVDKAAVKVAQVADKVIDKGFDWLINKGARAIEMRFPKFIPVVEVAKRALIFVKPAVKQVVKAGIKTVATFVKKAVPVVVKTAKKVWSGVKKVGRKVASWFGF